MRVGARCGVAVLALVTVCALHPGVASAGGSEKGTGKVNDTALLIIDIQQFYFEGGKLPLVRPVEASLQAKLLLERFRQLGRPVIHVQHMPKGMTRPDPTGCDPQYRIQENVLPLPGELVIGKHEANSFRDTDLEARLEALGVKKLVISGMQTHMCVEAATRAAADLGYAVTVVHDACATRDLTFGGTTVPAAQVHAATLAALSGTYARVVSAAELLAELK
jgi:nicotinamidase-related amidase